MMPPLADFEIKSTTNDPGYAGAAIIFVIPYPFGPSSTLLASILSHEGPLTVRSN